MKYTLSTALAAALAVQNVAAHATFQELWVDGVDYDTQCARQPLSNSPVTDVTSADMACNAGTSAVSSKCPVTAGSTVTIEMHQQPSDRSCSNEAIGGSHYGPVLVYMAAVSDASSAAGADAAWFKVFQDTWASNGTSGSDDNWGTRDLNTCCGMMDVLIPADLAPGDYLLRAEAIALHAAGGENGAQFYMTCYQITVAGSGAAAPPTVAIPGAYSASDPGILIDIYQSLATYEAPGPTVYSGGSTRSAGAPCANCEATCTAGSAATGVASSGAAAAPAAATAAATSAAGSTLAASSSSSSAAAASTSVAAAATSAAPSSAASPQTASTAAVSSSSTQAVVAAAAPASSTSSSAPAAGTGKSSCKRRRSRLARNL